MRARGAVAEPKLAWYAIVTSVALSLGACSGASQGRAEGPTPSPTSTTVVDVQSSTTPRSGQTTTTITTQATPAVPAAQATFAVRSVTDGDTLTLVDGRQVRLAQVDAPETNECFASQSTRGLRLLVEGRNVTLRRPSNGPEKDRYGRTLAEVSVADRSVNEQLVRDGAAEWNEEFAREDVDLAGRLRVAERAAQADRRGLWSACGAGARDDNPPATSQLVMPASGRCHPGYPDGCIPPAPPDLDCAEIKRRVRVDHAHGDPHRLDVHKDGWGCEAYG